MISRPASRPIRPEDLPRVAKMDQFRFYLFAGRHLVGVMVFAFLTNSAFRLGGPTMGWVMAGLTVVYGGFALVSARRLYQTWRRREAKASAFLATTNMGKE